MIMRTEPLTRVLFFLKSINVAWYTTPIIGSKQPKEIVMNNVKKWWRKNRYEIDEAARAIACGVAIGVITNSILLFRIKRIGK